MLEAIAIYLLNEFGSLIIGEAATSGISSIVQQWDRLLEVHKNIEEIKKDLRSMQSFLRDVDKMQSRSNSLNTWVDQLREAAYKAEDIIDEFMALVHSCQKGGLSGLAHNLLHFPADNPRKYDIATRVCDIKVKIHAISEKRHNFEPPAEGSSSSDASGRRESLGGELPPLNEGRDIMGIERERDLLVEWLTDGDERRHIIAVWGMGGLGKTTLVREAYNHDKITRLFYCRAWLSVSQTYSVEELLRSMAEELLVKDSGCRNDIAVMRKDSLLKKLQDFLANRRYVIVLDDVWNSDVWNEMSNAFPNNSCQSRIILTTRDHSIASSLAFSTRVLTLKKLQPNQAWNLFCKKAFWDGKCPPELVDWAGKIVDKCGGLPLAIVVIGGVMRSESSQTALGWKMMHRTLNWQLSSHSVLQPMTQILMLSYNNMPYHLKACFLYCSLFPEDYPIKTKWLAKLWIANGFVEESRGLVLEEVAEQYLEQLVARSMLQAVKRDELGRAKTCRVHDLLRELALTRAEKEKFCSVSAIGGAKLDGKGRHLSIIKSITTKVQTIDYLSQLRSLLAFDRDPSFISSLSSILSSCKFLRVLDLRGVPIEAVPDKVYDLFNLRYLSLRETKVTKISASLERLHNLQTLDLWKTGVTQLPREVVKLQALRHLFVEDIDAQKLRYRNVGHILRGKEAPSGMWDLRSLQTLRTIRADDDLITGLENLTQLRSLGITRLASRHEKALCNSLSKMQHLLRLSVKATAPEKLSISTLWSPPPQLQKLILNCRLGMVPQWFARLQSLTHLYLFESRLGEGERLVSSLQDLPCLTHLALDGAYEGWQLHFEKSFQRLRNLYLKNLKRLSSVIIKKGTMSNLSVLYLCECEQLRSLPEGIEHLPGLKDLYLRKMPRVDPSIAQCRPNVKILK